MVDSTTFDETPDPLDPNATVTLSTSATTSSATNASGNLNLSNSFDPFDPEQTFTADSAMNSGANPQSENDSTVNVNVSRRSEKLILDNVLNDYIDVIYNMSLAMVDFQAANSIRGDTIQGTALSSDQYLVFASTGDTKTGSTAANATMGSAHDLNFYGDYYNIQGLTFKNIVGHYPQNPMVAIAWDGRMRMFEPYGFQFREDLRDMAQALSYPEQSSPLEYVYRLEVWFSGWNPQNGAWIPQIGIPCPQPGNSANVMKSIVYYLTITTVDAKVIPRGTEYELSFQTFSHNATRPEYIMMHQEHVGQGGVHIDGKAGQSFGQFLKQLAIRLNKQVLNDTAQKIDVTYEFTGFKALFDSPFEADVNLDFSTGVTFDSKDGFHVSAAQGMDLYTLAYNIMRNVKLVRKLWDRTEDKEFKLPTVAWNIRTNIKEVGSPNPDTNLPGKYTFQYIFEPVLSYRSRVPPKVENYNDQIKAANQQARVQQMLSYGMLLRWYDYYFTGDNSEIIDFQFQFKMFYYMQIPYEGPETTMRGVADMTGDLAKTDGVSGEQLQFNAQASQQTSDVSGPNLEFTPSSADAPPDLSSLLNQTRPPVSQKRDGHNPPGNVHSYQNRGSMTFSGGDVSKSAKAVRIMHAQDQYNRYDMINAAMTVRFDPTWLMNPYMAGGDFTPTTNSKVSDGITVFANTDRVIYLNAFAPNQQSFMNPDASIFNVRETPILGGFYQVVSIENVFEGGKFYQKLSMFKYPHLNYYTQSDNNNPGIQQGGPDTTAASTGAAGVTADPNADPGFPGI